MNRKYLIIITLLISILSLSLSAFAAEQVFFYHTDPTGTPLAMTDASGSVVWQADYKPFGEENTITSSQENDRRFIGKEKDEETRLYYFGARYMESKIGRFTAVDPVGAVNPWTSKTNEALLLNPQRLNLYAYGLNNPYRYVDHDGNIAWPLIWDYADVGFFGYSLYKFSSEPSWSNAGDLALDTIGVLPVIPSIGSIKLVGKGIAKLGKSDDWAKLSGMLRDAAKGKGNFGIGVGTREQAEAMCKAWVGEEYSIASDGKILISADGLRQYRPASYKPNIGKYQANFEQRSHGQTTWQSNAHLDITD